MLCALALMIGSTVRGCDFCVFATAYTMPLMKPSTMAVTLPNVMGTAKKTSPMMAKGSLLRAPTMAYVVEDVARTHHAVLNEMNTAMKPEYRIPTNM